MLDKSMIYNSCSMLNRLSPTRLLLLIAEAIASIAVSSNRSLSNLLPVPRRLPSPALVIVELVDLLKGHVFGLVNEEVHEEDRDPGETAPDPEYIGLGRVESAGEVRCDEGQEPVEEPVGGGGLSGGQQMLHALTDIRSTHHGETLSTSLQWE